MFMKSFILIKRCWSSKIDGFAYPENVSKWLSKYLERENLHLVVFGSGLETRKIAELEKEHINSKPEDEVVYADLSPIMILSEESIKDLNSKLSNQVSVRNFRPNILLEGCKAYEEDNWAYFRIKNSEFRKLKHCTRCLLTTVDPEKGIKSADQEPLKTLKTYRMNKELYGLSPMFGVNATVDLIGEDPLIKIGDKIQCI